LQFEANFRATSLDGARLRSAGAISRACPKPRFASKTLMSDSSLQQPYCEQGEPRAA
jgi:hypothetical protein